MSSAWTVFDPDGINIECTTEAAALLAAADVIEEYLDCGEWHYSVKDVRIECGGKITHRAVEVACDPPEEVQEAMADDPEYRPPFDYYCDYKMVPVKGEHT